MIIAKTAIKGKCVGREMALFVGGFSEVALMGRKVEKYLQF